MYTQNTKSFNSLSAFLVVLDTLVFFVEVITVPETWEVTLVTYEPKTQLRIIILLTMVGLESHVGQIKLLSAINGLLSGTSLGSLRQRIPRCLVNTTVNVAVLLVSNVKGKLLRLKWSNRLSLFPL